MTTTVLKLCRLYITVNILNFLFGVVLCEDLPACMDKSEYGFELENHYQTLFAPNLRTCLITCMEYNNICRSFTYDVVSRSCKLNTETKSTKPELFKIKENNIYMSIASAFEITSPTQETTTNMKVIVSPPEQISKQSTANSLLLTTQATNISDLAITNSPPVTTSSTKEITTTGKPTSTSPPTTAESTNSFDGATFCIGKAGGDYPYPGDCTKYITCAPGHPIFIRECYSSVVPGICNDC